MTDSFLSDLAGLIAVGNLGALLLGYFCSTYNHFTILLIDSNVWVSLSQTKSWFITYSGYFYNGIHCMLFLLYARDLWRRALFLT